MGVLLRQPLFLPAETLAAGRHWRGVGNPAVAIASDPAHDDRASPGRSDRRSRSTAAGRLDRGDTGRSSCGAAGEATTCRRRRGGTDAAATRRSRRGGTERPARSRCACAGGSDAGRGHWARTGGEWIWRHRRNADRRGIWFERRAGGCRLLGLGRAGGTRWSRLWMDGAMLRRIGFLRARVARATLLRHRCRCCCEQRAHHPDWHREGQPHRCRSLGPAT
jgi:hypothetical protein